MELSPHEDTADDEFCAWYSRPDLEHACFSHNANLLPTDLCTECKESTSHELIEIYHNFRGDYTFRKTYAEIRRDAAVCALCRAIDDSSHLSRLLPPIATPPVIPPPDSTIHLKGLFYDSFGIGMKKGGYFVSARGSTRSSSGFAYEPIRLGYLDPIISQSIDTDANTSRSESADSELDRLPGATVDLCIASPRNPNSSFPVGNSGREEWSVAGCAYDFVSLARADNLTLPSVTPGGGSDLLKTTIGSYGNFQDNIPAGGLCETIRQAARITYAIGVAYMWIDSLCIVQDDAEDWARESPKMVGHPYSHPSSCLSFLQRDVYANAYLTISASAQGRNGCYPHKLTDSRHAKIIQGKNKMRLIPQPSDAAHWNMLNEPLQSRGWTLQERLLSHRVLYCSKLDYYWLCRETQECAAHSFASAFFNCTGIDPHEDILAGFLYDLPLLLPASAQPIQALVLWYKMLLDYSVRLLTEPSDKLPAIEGITQRFKMWIKSDCLHGLWKSDLAYGLMWRRHWASFTQNRYDSSDYNRLVRGRVPSWSWANTDGYLEQLGIYIKLSMWKPSQDHHRALEASVAVADEDEHSMYPSSTSIINPCLLKIRGQLLPLKYNRDSEGRRGGMPYWQLQDPQPGDKVEVHFTADDPNFDPSESTSGSKPSIYLLPIIGLMALVVTPTDRHNVYRRVGLSSDMDLRTIIERSYRHLSSTNSLESTSTSHFTQESCFGGDGAEDEDVAALEDSGEGLGGGRSKEKASANSASDSSSVSQDESSRGERESGSESKTSLPWEEQYSPSAKFCTIFLC
ncbi:uncharacterized protein NECHADRAFT_77345 [Fusarium vanettenii 77-13-4]|uniref:Heterokaryon incompatibility domain-containing protein n=1 Tax=Fusarium vanettenii (strain ATCC MYA-4622 / CBS 123669 / FGSC 9596 / NRRL 45880 / 77-13-4) TaxID=660122 RepID=C7YKZ2_FUSV7|nr:uncharacterized protein NECHADRAFT_77345 [Fusarium vanettenii 77-13-4]EEU46705.1 hypothetical protein NECHADRAFT_77345 [Fusarium vanettenii 77-13-4]